MSRRNLRCSHCLLHSWPRIFPSCSICWCQEPSVWWEDQLSKHLSAPLRNGQILVLKHTIKGTCTIHCFFQRCHLIMARSWRVSVLHLHQLTCRNTVAPKAHNMGDMKGDMLVSLGVLWKTPYKLCSFLKLLVLLSDCRVNICIAPISCFCMTFSEGHSWR